MHYIALHYITSHTITLHYITLHYIHYIKYIPAYVHAYIHLYIYTLVLLTNKLSLSQCVYEYAPAFVALTTSYVQMNQGST